MERSLSKARYEEQLARAHRSLYWAARRATELGKTDDAELLESLCRTVTSIGAESIRDRPRRPGRGQTTIHDHLTRELDDSSRPHVS